MRTRMRFSAGPKYCTRQTASPLSPAWRSGGTVDQSVVTKGMSLIFIWPLPARADVPSGMEKL